MGSVRDILINMVLHLPSIFASCAEGPPLEVPQSSDSDSDSDIEKVGGLDFDMKDRPIEAIIEEISYLVENDYTGPALDLISSVLNSESFEKDPEIVDFLNEFKKSLIQSHEPEKMRPVPVVSLEADPDDLNLQTGFTPPPLRPAV